MMKLEKLSWFPKLLLRLSLGSVFLLSGWGKLHGIENVIEYFNSLGIPFPIVNAYFISYLEFIGGSALLLGLGYRFISLLLAFTMAVAIVTAKRSEIQNLTDLLGCEEFIYASILFWFVTVGAGKLSMDYFLVKKLRNANDQNRLSSSQ